MANSRSSNKNYVEIVVDTDPGATGYASEAARSLHGTEREMWFYVSSITGTVTLQWKHINDSTWVDYDDYTEVTRKVIHDTASETEWRVVVKDGGQNATAGIDW